MLKVANTIRHRKLDDRTLPALMATNEKLDLVLGASNVFKEI